MSSGSSLARQVAVLQSGAVSYPAAPFSPSERYPEYRAAHLSGEPNPVYAAVRECFRLLALDAEHYGTREWNPLGAWIRPGMRVLLKPNLVRHYHPKGLDTQAIYTHASLVRAAADYVWLALRGEGELAIADAPLQSCDFDQVCRLSGLFDLAEYYASRGLPVELRDLRLVRSVAEKQNWLGKVLVLHPNAGDPMGYTTINLGGASLHAQRERSGRYRVPCYDPAGMESHHAEGRHSYIVANTLLRADFVLSLPKMKTHHKAGITGALKNFIGINGHKDCLPHHVQGASDHGGDEYARPSRLKEADSRLLDYKERNGGLLVKKAAAITHRILHSTHMRESGNNMWDGGWYGNDTISRTTIDLNRIVRFSDANGVLHDTLRRTVFSIIDGIVAGERDGPLAPRPKPCGLLLAGCTPPALDAVMARLMGFQWQSIATLRHAFDPAHGLADFEPSEIETLSNDPQWQNLAVGEPGPSLNFEPNPGWKGHIEL